MISASTMGIIFPNIHDDSLPELVQHRAMASTPFAGRYRMIDFCLSGMANAGIQNIGVIVRKNYQSLMDHLGNGREWDLTRKRGGLVMFPPFARDGGETYRGRIQALASVFDYMDARTEDLVVMSDSNIAFNMDYKELLRHHTSTGADVTVVYEQAEICEGMQRDNIAFSFDDNGLVCDIRVNDYKKGMQNLSMFVFVIGRKHLMDVVRESIVRGENKFVQDFLAHNLSTLKVCGYEFKGYRARIYNMQSYFSESMRLLDANNLAGLFPEDFPVYTKVRDEAPVRYAIGCKVSNTLAADGCIIEGEVENCVLFRGVRVGKGAKLKNCIIMQGTQIEPEAILENVITDKNVVVGSGQYLRGAASFPVFIAKGFSVT